MSDLTDRFVRAAHLSNPWEPNTLPDLEQEQADAMVAILKKNKVPLLLLRQKYGQAIENSPFYPYLQEEESEFQRLREEFERIRIAFEDSGIDTLFIKSTGLYPSFPYLSCNLDVIVPIARGDQARRQLRELGYVELLNVEERKKFLFRKFIWGLPSYTFHMHEEVGWGVPFMQTRLLWRQARSAPDDPSIRIPGSMDALLITLAHWFYEDKTLSLGNLFLTANALRDLNRPLEEAAARASIRGWENGFFAAVKIFSESWKKIFSAGILDAPTEQYIEKKLGRERLIRSFLLPKVRYLDGHPAEIPFAANKLVYYKKVMADQKRSFPLKIKDVAATLLWAIQLKGRVRSQKAFLVGISGCDGSGKTLQAELLEQAFQTCALRTKIIWARGSSSRFMSVFIKAAKRILGRDPADRPPSPTAGSIKSSSPQQNEKIRRQQYNLRNPVVRFIYSLLYAADLSWAYIIITRFYLLFGNIVICDRYTADARVDFLISSGRPDEKPPLAIRLLEIFSPRASKSFVLDVDEAEALRRKPEEGDTDHLGEARKLFQAIAEECGMSVVPPDASREEVYERVVEDCLAAYYRKHKTLLNAILWKNPGQLNPDRWRD